MVGISSQVEYTPKLTSKSKGSMRSKDQATSSWRELPKLGSEMKHVHQKGIKVRNAGDLSPMKGQEKKYHWSFLVEQIISWLIRLISTNMVILKNSNNQQRMPKDPDYPTVFAGVSFSNRLTLSCFLKGLVFPDWRSRKYPRIFPSLVQDCLRVET